MFSSSLTIYRKQREEYIVAKDLSFVHPELRQMAKMFPRLPFRRWNLRLIRWLSKLQPKAKQPDDIQVDNVWIQSQDPGHKIRLRVYRPRMIVTPAPVLVWMHGGGFFIGTPEQNDAFLFHLVQELSIVVVSIDYRLAPEHPFPTPLYDCYAALKWVQTHPQLLGIDSNRIAIGGESAGGGLAASLAQLAHDRGEIHPVFQLLVYPMLDDRTTLRTDMMDKEWIAWSIENNRLGWEVYLHQPCGLEKVPDYAVASRRADLTGLPPAWIGVGTLDLFYEEDLAYAQAQKRCNVSCEVLIVSGAFHAFDQFDPKLNVVQDFRKSQIAVLRTHLFPK
jgi:acetyl esterase/lipase